jgi:primosomal protein N' (replication factor Y)
MNLIDRVIADGRHVIVMVPEISLTPQMLSLFLKRYGSRIAVLHSGLAIGERMDEWKRIKRGEAQITVGTRSAVFAPVDNLGLIIMDEEQEHTYKSESSPRYHARDVGRFRCARNNAMLLLTSATPSVETYYAAQNGRYSFQKLTSRFGEAGLPEVEIVDMRQQSDSLIGSIVSDRLKQEIDQTRFCC